MLARWSSDVFARCCNKI